MTLSASRGTVITVRADGPDEAEAADAVARLVAGGFDEA
jgi:phosphotransferase system HPr-like phosphotransfer protein